jgi:hypothetical protein
MVENMDKTRAAIQHECGMLSFYMQGGLSLNDSYMLSGEQRQLLGKIIQKHYESMNPSKKGQMM